jgi:hypothetical protein
MMRTVTITLLDELASRCTNTQAINEFSDALLSFIGADDAPLGLQSALRSALITGEMAWSRREESTFGPHEFLNAIAKAIGDLQLQEAFSLSENDLLLTIRSLSRAMPHIFSDPASRKGLRAAGRLYLIYLLWINGKFGKEDEIPLKTGSYTVASFSNGRRSGYQGLRDKLLSRSSESKLIEISFQLIQLLTIP